MALGISAARMMEATRCTSVSGVEIGRVSYGDILWIIQAVQSARKLQHSFEKLHQLWTRFFNPIFHFDRGHPGFERSSMRVNSRRGPTADA